MSGQELPFEFRLKTGRYDENSVRAELNGLRSTNAFKKVMNDIEGTIPPEWREGRFSKLQRIVLTDKDKLGRDDTNNPAMSYVNSKGEWVVYLNPNKIKFDPETARIMTVAELPIHEIGHATKDGIDAGAQKMYTGSDGPAEAVANRYEHQFTSEKCLKPIPEEHSDNSIRAFNPDEKPYYFTKIDPGCFLGNTIILTKNNVEKNISEIRPVNIVKSYD